MGKVKKRKRIVICGSMSFAKKMLLAGKKLEEMGFEVFLPPLVKGYARGARRKDYGKKDAQAKKEIDALNLFFKEIKKSDGVLVLNCDKKGKSGYIGGNTLIEMGFGYILKKKIFVLDPILESEFKSEIMAMDVVVLNGKVENILREI